MSEVAEDFKKGGGGGGAQDFTASICSKCFRQASSLVTIGSRSAVLLHLVKHYESKSEVNVIDHRA